MFERLLKGMKRLAALGELFFGQSLLAFQLGDAFFVSGMSFPFAWPSLGHVTTSTREYVQLLLEVHEEKGVILRQSKGD